MQIDQKMKMNLEIGHNLQKMNLDKDNFGGICMNGKIIIGNYSRHAKKRKYKTFAERIRAYSFTIYRNEFRGMKVLHFGYNDLERRTVALLQYPPEDKYKIVVVYFGPQNKFMHKAYPSNKDDYYESDYEKVFKHFKFAIFK